MSLSESWTFDKLDERGGPILASDEKCIGCFKETNLRLSKSNDLSGGKFLYMLS